MGNWSVLASVALVLLTGCTGTPASDHPPDDSTGATPGGTADAPARPPPPASAGPLDPTDSPWILDGCDRWTALIEHENVIYAPEGPSGWEKLGIIPEVVYRYEVYECRRVSWGTFERGPVRMAFQSHDYYQAPESCRDGVSGAAYLLVHGITDDAELAQAIQAEIGLPTVVGTISIETNEQHGLVMAQVRWGAGDNLVELTFLPYTGSKGPAQFETVDFVYDGSTLAALHTSKTQHYTDPEFSLVEGQVGPATSYGQAGGSQVFTNAQVLSNVHQTREITLHEDPLCSGD